MGPDRQGVCKVTDARLAVAWGVFQRRPARGPAQIALSRATAIASREEDCDFVAPFFAQQRGDTLYLSPTVAEAFFGTLVLFRVLQPRVSPLFAELLYHMRTVDHFVTLVERCDNDLESIASGMDEGMIRSVVRQAAIAIELARVVARVQFDRLTPLSSIFLCDIESMEDNVSWNGSILKNSTKFACRFGDKVADFPHHNFMVKVGAYSRGITRTARAVAYETEPLRPCDVCRKLLLAPGLLYSAAGARGWLERLAGMTTSSEFLREAFSGCFSEDKGFYEGIMVGTLGSL